MNEKIQVKGRKILNRPSKKWKSGGIEAAIWVNKRDIDGAEIEFKTVSLSRSYRKKGEDTWRNDVIHMRRGDIQKVMIVLQKAQEELYLTEKEGNEEEGL